MISPKRTSGQVHVSLAENHRAIQCPPSDKSRFARYPSGPDAKPGDHFLQPDCRHRLKLFSTKSEPDASGRNPKQPQQQKTYE